MKDPALLHDLIETLALLRVYDILEFEEKYDQQYHALKFLKAKFRGRNFIALVALNALVCYRLSCRGETYWWEFSRYFTKLRPKDSLSMLKEFLSSSRCNRLGIRQKLRRIEKVHDVVDRLVNNINWLVRNQLRFAWEVARRLGCDTGTKTVAFMVKMVNYALRISTGEKIVAPFDIDIPLDRRILDVSGRLGIRNSRQEWRRISLSTGIPPLHIDSLIWVGYELSREGLLLVDNDRIRRILEIISKVLRG